MGQNRFKKLSKSYVKKHFNYTCASWPYLGTGIAFKQVFRGVSPTKELQRYLEIFQFNRIRFKDFFLYDLHSEWNKTDSN